VRIEPPQLLTTNHECSNTRIESLKQSGAYLFSIKMVRIAVALAQLTIWSIPISGCAWLVVPINWQDVEHTT
jgi:hypothetical protein